MYKYNRDIFPSEQYLQLVFLNAFAGASSDFSQATLIARAMVTKYAMSDKVNQGFLHRTVET